VYPGYDRGHLATSSHMNLDDNLRKRANYITNIVPQATNFNQGIWKETESLLACMHLRQGYAMHVFGGVVFTDPSNNFFLESHGIQTPNYMYAILI
jgi:endonuclease G, mitochondrial